MVPGGEGRRPAYGRGAVRPGAATSSRSRPTIGRSSTVISTSAGSRPTAAQWRVQDVDLAQQGRLVAGQVGRVGLLGDDPQGPPLPGPADDDRDVADRPGIAGGLGQPDVAAGVRLGAGRPERAQRLDADLQLVEPLGVGGEVQPVRLVLAQPPARAEPAEGPAVAERVEGRGGLGDDPGRPERHRRDQRAQPQPGVEPGEQAQRHPRFGDGLPGAVDLGDLDQVVHQGDARRTPAASAARARSRQPAVGSSPHGNRETCRITRGPSCGSVLSCRRPVAPVMRGWLAVLVDDQDLVPALVDAPR